MKSTINPMAEDKNIWTSKQTYIAMGNLLHAAAELKLIPPMEGFAPQLNEILGLETWFKRFSYSSYWNRHEDETQHYKKS
jgi:hypothetical protein